jgi:polyisoprenoid-binding protein YceI
MLAPENLASDSHPEIRFRSSSVKPAEGQWLVNGELSIRGRAQPVAVPVKVAPRPSGFAFTGKFSAKQSDFGIKPSSVGGGTVKVKDEVSILFDISAIPNGPCK